MEAVHCPACRTGEAVHAGEERPAGAVRPDLLLVGQPNVGKSLLFNRLTGARVAVSNYPGTSVDVSTGTLPLPQGSVRVVDTPGTYGLSPVTEDERVTRELVMAGAGRVVHVVEARNLERSLPLTLQLREAGRLVAVALNMMDEARSTGLRIDHERLSRRLGVPVVPMVATTGEGVDALQSVLADSLWLRVPDPPDGPGTGAEAPAGAVAEREGARDDPGDYRRAVERRRAADELAAGVVQEPREQGDPSRRTGARLGRWLARPVTGIPVLAAVLYLGLYQFVGVFGAGTVVDWLEGTVFEGHLNPLLEALFAPVPWEAVSSLFVGEYGLLTLGVRYAVAIVLPLVATFFLFFALLEDSGYLPRLSLLVDRAFKKIGLNGRAVIPMVLGFACDTMATMVTRTLETRRERVLATVLLALAVPCSAQLGVILAVLAGNPAALGIWAGVMVASFLLVGAAGARLLPGRPATFHMELPPMRVPRLRNVASKTAARVHWYFMEVLPLFLLASVILWAGDHTGLLALTLDALGPVVGALGLPDAAASVLLFGFFRRDYGAAGLFDLHGAGALDPVQLTVAAVTLTLFIPCVAQFLMMWKERGWRMALATAGFASGFAVGVGAALNLVLRSVGPWS